jgi:hypothetical protein
MQKAIGHLRVSTRKQGRSGLGLAPNKATAAVREAIAQFAEQNVGKLQGWLDRVAVLRVSGQPRLEMLSHRSRIDAYSSGPSRPWSRDDHHFRQNYHLGSGTRAV